MTRWSVLLTVRQAPRLRWLGLKKPQPAAQLATTHLTTTQRVTTQLAADASGRWALRERDEASWHAVALTRYWRGPCWVRLMLAATAAPDHPAAGRRWTITVWRSAVSTDDWRKLGVLLRAAREPRCLTALPA